MKGYSNRIRTLLLVFWAAVVLACISGCAPWQNAGEEFVLPEIPPPPPEPGEIRTGLLYYPDQEWRFLVPVYREIPETETVVRSTLEKLVTTPQLQKELEPLGLVPLLPGETGILGIHVDETGPARVDFSESFLQYNAPAECLVLGGLLCTLRQFPEIERLEIMIEGQIPEKFPGGTSGRMPLGPECLLNLEVDDALEDYRNFTAVTVYFCLLAPRGRILYVPVTRALPPVAEHFPAALEELLAGPRSGSGLFSDIPPGTKVRNLKSGEGLTTIDLSGELLTYRGGRTGAENMINQILLTLARLPEAGKVQILVEGEKVRLPDGPDLSVPLEPPAVYNFF